MFLYLLSNFSILWQKDYRLLLLVVSFFVCWLIISLIASEGNFAESLYGVTGRQNGTLTFLCLISFFLVVVINVKDFSADKYIGLLTICGFAASLYGFIQALGLDPFDWINPYSPVFSFFGNPNFHSAFIGLTGVAMFSKILNVIRFSKVWLFYFCGIILVSFNLVAAKSQQGFFVLAIGLIVLTLIFLRKRNEKLFLSALGASALGFIAIVADLLRLSPWTPLFYEESISFRGDFWRVGYRIAASEPLFGVGLDGYRDYFRTFRDYGAYSRSPDSSISSAHNIFLDLASGGGLPLLASYIFIIFLTARSAFRVLKRNESFDIRFATVLSCWVAFTAQSLISINQIGLAIWGFVASGLIIGYEIQGKSDVRSKSEGNPSKSLIFSLGFLLGFCISLPLYLVDSSFRTSVASGEVLRIVDSVKKWPQSPIRMNMAAQLLRNGNFPDQALDVSRSAVEKFPRNFEAWQELSLNEKSSSMEKSEAIAKMRELDPLNTSILSGQ